MEFTFQRDNESCRIIYGETFAASLAELDFQQQHLVIVTNQRYYDLFSQKINQLLAQADVDWYICPNQRSCNSFSELTNSLDFLAGFTRQEFIFIAFGNEGVVELTNFLQKNTLLNGQFWALSVSLRSFSKALLGSGQIINQRHQPLLGGGSLPQLILFDQTLSQEQSAGKLLDLLVFIKCGLICDRNFLKELFFNYPHTKNVMSKPLSGMLLNLAQYYQKAGSAIDSYGLVFKQAFFLVSAGQVLSDSMKEFLGILFHLLWNIQTHELNFNYRNFLHWLKDLGYPIELPANFLISDYAEAVLQVAQKSESLLTLAKIGTIEGTALPAGQELVTMLEGYQEYTKEMRD